MVFFSFSKNGPAFRYAWFKKRLMELRPGGPLGPWWKDRTLLHVAFLIFSQGSLAWVRIRSVVVNLRQVEATFAGSGPVTPSTRHAAYGPLRPGTQTWEIISGGNDSIKSEQIASLLNRSSIAVIKLFQTITHNQSQVNRTLSNYSQKESEKIIFTQSYLLFISKYFKFARWGA